MNGHTGWFRRRMGTAVGSERNGASGQKRGRKWGRAGARNRVRPAMLVLEDRCLLSGSFTVTSTADSAPANNPAQGTLRWAVEQADASPGGAAISFNLSNPATITLAQGPLDLDNQFGALAIDGPGAGSLTVSGGGLGQVFTLNGVPQGGQTASISDLTISGGSSTGTGGAVVNHGFMTFTSVTFSGNTAGTNGGGLYNRGWMTLLDCTLSGNSAKGNGGAFDNAGLATLIDTAISSNTSGTTGSSLGGGLENEKTGMLTLTGCTISGNTAGQLGDGGGLSNDGTVNLADCTLSSNTAMNNGSGSSGGGLQNGFSGTANLTDCTLSGNTANVGGGLNDFGTANLTDCTFTGNSAAYSGGVNGLGPLTLTGSTITGNSVSGRGGGLGTGSGTTTLTNTTITGNTALVGGGGVANYGPTALTACTISGNTSATGGGIANLNLYGYTGAATLTDTIVAGNIAPGGAASDIGGNDPTGVAGTDNLIGTGGSGGITGGMGGNLVGIANPGLAALASNGGLTQTMALQTGSPAIGAGVAVSGVTTDQRGLPRPTSGAVDMGAFETQSVPDSPPIAAYQAATTSENTVLTGQVSANDPDNNPLTYSLVSAPLNGTLTLQSNGSFTYTPTTNTTGPDSFTFEAFDGIAYSNVATVSIVVYGGNAAPVAYNESYAAPENTTLTVVAPGVLTPDQDPDGDPITAVLVTGPSHGTLTLNADGSFGYTPATNYLGSDSFTYEASDGELDSNVATVILTVAQPPVAANQSYATAESKALTVAAPGVLTNSTDPSTTALTASVLAGPSHGTLTLNSNGSFTYTPTTNYIGADNFTYLAYDGVLYSNVATVTLEVGVPLAQNDAYGYTPNSTLTTTAGQTSLTMTSQPGDFIGQGQTYNFTASNSTITAQSLWIGGIPSTVEVNVSASGQSWTLDFAAPTPDSLVPGTYTGATRYPFQAAGVPGLNVSGDGRGANTLTGQFTVSQAVFNASGNIVSFAASFVQYGDGSTASLSGQVDFNFTNNLPNGVLANDTNPQPGTSLTAQLVSGPSHGSLTLNTDGSFTYTPTSGFSGTDSFTYMANNGQGTSNVATVTLAPDSPPTAKNDTYSVAENSVLPAGAGSTFVVMNSQPGDFIGAGIPYDFTPANSTITAQAFSSTVQIGVSMSGEIWTLDFQAPYSGPLMPGTYTGATIFPSQTSGVPGLDVYGDGRGSDSITGEFTVSQAVYNSSGTITSFAATFVQHSDGATAPLTGQVAFNTTIAQPSSVLANDTDPNPGTTLTASLISNPSDGKLLLNSDGTFVYAPNPGFVGTDSFTYQASDGHFSSNVATVTLTVAPPVASNDSYTAGENTPLTVAKPGVLGNDTDPDTTALGAVLVAGPAHGSLTLNGDGSFTYTPASNFTGSDSFTYQDTDGTATSNTATVSIMVAQLSQATFLKTDTTTQGSWIKTYGTQGYDVIGDTPSLSPYATVTPSGELTHVWSASTTAPQALQNPGGSGRIEECWYSPTSFTVNLDLIDGQLHDIELYFLDLQSSPSRVEQIQISDAGSGTVLDTETVSSFTGGVYLDWKVQGDVTITITHQAGVNAVLSGIFVDPAATTSSSATFLKTDTTTQGSWIKTYGTQGYDVIGDTPSLSPYATVTPSGELTHVWSASTTAPQALQNPGGSGRIEECWYSPTSFTVNLDLIDGQLHDIELYFLDLQSSPSRVEQIQISDAGSGKILDTETVSSFTNGVYLDWKVQGDVTITITHQAGVNAVLSGIFVDPAATTSSSATFLKTDTTTQGSWIKTYGTQGYDVIGDTPSLSPYATVSPSGELTHVWSASTTAPQALQNPGGSGRIEECWYSPTSFTVNLDLIDGQLHDIELYFLDLQSSPSRVEQIQISDAGSGKILDTETVSSFTNGVYLDWKVQGDVTITITHQAGVNAVLSGIFIDPVTPSPPATHAAVEVGQDNAPRMTTVSTPTTPAIGTLDTRSGNTVAPLSAIDNSTSPHELVHDVALERFTEELSVPRRRPV